MQSRDGHGDDIGRQRVNRIIGLSRNSDPPLDLTDEDSMTRAMVSLSATGLPLRLAFDATGFLHGPQGMPEKSWRDLDPVALARKRPEAIIVAPHPGTVDSGLSAPFSKKGLAVRPPDLAARNLLDVIDGLSQEDSGGFHDYAGKSVPW